MAINKYTIPLGQTVISNPSDNEDGYTLIIRNRNSNGPTVFVDSSSIDGYGIEFEGDAYIGAPRGTVVIEASDEVIVQSPEDSYTTFEGKGLKFQDGPYGITKDGYAVLKDIHFTGSNISSEGTLSLQDNVSGPFTLSQIASFGGIFRPSKTWFVAENGDDGGTGGPQDPFATVQKAIDTASAFETVFVYSGTYVQGSLTMKASVPIIGEAPGAVVIVFNSAGIVPASSMTFSNLTFSNVQSGGLSIPGSLQLFGTTLTEVGGNPGLTVPGGASLFLDETSQVSNTAGPPALIISGGTAEIRGEVNNIGGGPALTQSSGISLICQSVLESTVGAATVEISGGTAGIHNSMIRNTSGSGGALLVSGGTVRLGSNDLRTSGTGLELEQTSGTLTIGHDAFDPAKSSFSGGTLVKLANADVVLNFSGPFDGYSVTESLTQLNEPSTVTYVGDGYIDAPDGSFKLEARDEIILEVPTDSYTTFEGYGLKLQDGPYGITKDGYAVLKDIHLVGSTISSDGSLSVKGTEGINIDSGINLKSSNAFLTKEMTKIDCIGEGSLSEVTDISFDSYANTGSADYFLFFNLAGNSWATWLDKSGSDASPTGADFIGADNTVPVDISGTTTNADVAAAVLAELSTFFGPLDTIGAVGVDNFDGSITISHNDKGVVTDPRVHNSNDTGPGSISATVTTQGQDSDLAGNHFFLYTALDAVKNYIWFDPRGDAIDPAIAGFVGIEETTLVEGDSAVAVCSALETLLDANGYDAYTSGSSVFVTNLLGGTTTDGYDANTGMTISVITQGASHNVTSNGSSVIGVDSSNGPITITIDSADIIAGRIIDIKDTGGSASSNNITIETEGSALIDGASSATISKNFGTARLYSDGTNLFDLTKLGDQSVNDLGSVSGTVNIDWSISELVYMDVGSNSVTVTMSNVPDTGKLTVLVKSAPGGAISFPNDSPTWFAWFNNGLVDGYALTQSSNAFDKFQFTRFNGNNFSTAEQDLNFSVNMG